MVPAMRPTTSDASFLLMRRTVLLERDLTRVAPGPLCETAHPDRAGLLPGGPFLPGNRRADVVRDADQTSRAFQLYNCANAPAVSTRLRVRRMRDHFSRPAWIRSMLTIGRSADVCVRRRTHPGVESKRCRTRGCHLSR